MPTQERLVIQEAMAEQMNLKSNGLRNLHCSALRWMAEQPFALNFSLY